MLETDLNHVRGVFLHAELIQTTLQSAEDGLACFDRPKNYDLGDSIVSEWVANQVHDFFRNSAHQRLLHVSFFGLLNQDFDDTESVAVDTKINKIFLDLAQHSAKLFLEATPQKFLDNVCSLLVFRKLKDSTSKAVLEDFLFFWYAERVNDGLDSMRASFVGAD